MRAWVGNLQNIPIHFVRSVDVSHRNNNCGGSSNGGWMADGFGRIADKGISRAINLVKCSLVLPPRFLSVVAVASDRLGIL